MTQAPLHLVTLVEDPASGGEKIVSLTPKGEAHMKRMIAQGSAYVQQTIDPTSNEEIVDELSFFALIGGIVDGLK